MAKKSLAINFNGRFLFCVLFRSTQKRSRAKIWMEKNNLNVFQNLKTFFMFRVTKFIQLMPVYLVDIYSWGAQQQRSEKQVQVQELFGNLQKATNSIYGNKFTSEKIKIMSQLNWLSKLYSSVVKFIWFRHRNLFLNYNYEWSDLCDERSSDSLQIFV